MRKLLKEIDFSADFEINTGLEVIVSFDETEVIDQIRMGRAEKILGNGQKLPINLYGNFRDDMFKSTEFSTSFDSPERDAAY